MEQQTVYDLAKKHDPSLDLIEKNMAGNGLVYELRRAAGIPFRLLRRLGRARD